MLAEKPWKPEAVCRLCIALFICQFLGAMVLAALRVFTRPAEINLWLVGALTIAGAGCCIFGLYQLRRPWKLDDFSRKSLLLIFVVYAGLTMGLFVQHLAGDGKNDNLALRVSVGALCFQGLLIAFMPRFLREHGENWNGGFGLTIKPGPALLYGVIVGLAFFKLAEVLQWISMEIISRFGGEPQVQAAVEALKKSNLWYDRAALAVVAVALAPIAEELLFRGILYPAVKRGGFPRLALWGTSILFALIHMNGPTFLPLLLFALTLVFLYEWTGNLLAPLAAHALFNLLNFVKFLWYERQLG